MIDLNIISESTGAESILIMNFEGIEKSGGSTAKDILASTLLAAVTGVVAVSQQAASHVEIALIDASNGDVLWSNVRNGSNVSSSLAKAAMYNIPTDID